eukprot:14876524-Heterocapsa_arctica.AAC.1
MIQRLRKFPGFDQHSLTTTPGTRMYSEQQPQMWPKGRCGLKPETAQKILNRWRSKRKVNDAAGWYGA